MRAAVYPAGDANQEETTPMLQQHIPPRAAVGPTVPPRPATGHVRRRRLLGGTAVTLAASVAPVVAPPGGPAAAPGEAAPRPATGGASFAYVGCRTTRERNARGDGINVYRVDAASGRWEHVQLVPGLLNPSFLAFDRTKSFLYTVHGDGDAVSAFRVHPATGRLAPINRQGTKGKNPVHLAVDPTNRFLVVANHITSGLAVLPIRDDGSLGEVSDLVTLEGPIGPHRVEQPFAKPHQAEFDPAGRFVVVPDKGLDRVFTFRLDGAGKLVAADPPWVQARETSGPRHVAFHPALPYAYVVNELDSTVTGYRYDAATGRLSPFQVVSCLPQSYTGNSRASEIAVSADGGFVYASNRGFDSVAVFSVAPETGWLTTVAVAPSGGKTPRFFALDPTGRFMHVANEDSDAIVTFALDRATGELAETGDVVTTGSPVCIVFR